MGYWGTLVVMRGTEMPPALQARGATVRTHEGAARGDGWRTYDVPDTPLTPDLVRELAVGSPVITAYIADSDYGQVVAADPADPADPAAGSGGMWGAWLDPATAYAFERDHHLMLGHGRAAARRRARDVIAGFGSPPAVAARNAVAWAAAAGYVAHAGPVRRLLRTARRPGPAGWLPAGRHDFAEDVFFALLDRLGLPRA